MAEPVTLHDFIGILALAMGGREGVAYYIKKRNGKTTNGFVTEKFCNERTGNLEKTLDGIQEDVKTLLQRPHT